MRIPSLASGLATVVLLVSVVAQAAAPEGFADLVERVRPAVVNIAAVQDPEGAPYSLQPAHPGQETSIEDVLRLFLDPFGEKEATQRPPSTSLGSGFIIDPTGLVVTSVHVIQGADRIHVTLVDGRKFASRLVGRDDETDIALLQIESDRPLPFVAWGDSDAARIGDWVIAVGNPFGLGGTVTAGIISARGRDIQSGRFDDYLQIDASINRGNSGGPSFDRLGLVIGINSVIYSTGGGSIGIGFATPSAIAKPIVEELRHYGHVRRGWLGVSTQAVTREIADSLGLQTESGALVTSIVPKSPASRAGLQQGDVVLAVNGHVVEQSRDLTRLIASTNPGQAVHLRVWREDTELLLSAALEQAPRPDAAVESLPPTPKSEPPLTTVMGLALLPINRETQLRFGLPEDARGALIVGATPDFGVMPGDIVTRVGRTPVTDPKDVVAGVKEAKAAGRGAVLLLIRRLNAERFVAIPIPVG